MKRARFLAMLLVVLGLWLPGSAWSAELEKPGYGEAAPQTLEEEAAALEEECPATFGPIVTDTAVPAAKGEFSIQPTWWVSMVTDSFSPSWRRVSAGGDFTNFTMLLKFTYGLAENLEVFLEMTPYTHNWASDVNEPGPKGERSADFGGIGDLALVAKYQMVAETPTVPTVTAFGGIVFPTGHYRYLNPSRLGTDELGGGTYSFTLGLNLSKWLRPFIFYGNLWYSMSTDYTGDGEDEAGNPAQVHYHPRDAVTVNLAAEYPITEKWIALFELYSTWDAGRLFGPKPNVEPAALLSCLPGIEYMATDKLSMALGLGIDLIGKHTDATISPVLSLVYVF